MKWSCEAWLQESDGWRENYCMLNLNHFLLLFTQQLLQIWQSFVYWCSATLHYSWFIHNHFLCFSFPFFFFPLFTLGLLQITAVPSASEQKMNWQAEKLMLLSRTQLVGSHMASFWYLRLRHRQAVHSCSLTGWAYFGLQEVLFFR